MFELYIDTRIASVKRREKITAGSVGIQCGFTFSSDWDGLGKTAVFETDKHKIAVVLNTPAVTIPWEVCEEANLDVIVGVYGTNAYGTIVIPTIYAKLGAVAVGTTTDGAENAQVPTSTDVQQILAASANAVSTANTANNTAGEAKSIAQSVEQRAIAGEFNGKDGAPGRDGTSVSITDISESTESGGTSVVTFSNGKTLRVKNGLDGKGGQSGSDVTKDTVRSWGFVEDADLAGVAKSGNYNDLSNKPTIPDALSDLSDDSTHRVVTDVEKNTWNAKSNFDGDYNSLRNRPAIPAAVTENTVAQWGFAKTGGLGYVTPQMYGAYGDGVHDDTAALNACLHDNKFVLIPKGYYRITSKLTAECRDVLSVVADTKAVFVADSSMTGCMLEFCAFVGYSMLGASWTGGVFCCNGVPNLTGIKVNKYCHYGHFNNITIIDIGDGGTGLETNVTSASNDFDNINIFSATFDLHPENPDGNLTISKFDLTRTNVGFKSISSFDFHVGTLIIMGCTVGIQTDGGAQVDVDYYHHWLGASADNPISVDQYKKTRSLECLNDTDYWYFGTFYSDEVYIAVEAAHIMSQFTHYICTRKEQLSDLTSWDDPACYLGMLTNDYGNIKLENLDINKSGDLLAYRGIKHKGSSGVVAYQRNAIVCEYAYWHNFGYLHPSLAWNNSDNAYMITYNKGSKYVIGYALVNVNGTAHVEITGYQNLIAASFDVACKSYAAAVYNDFALRGSQTFDITISLGTIFADDNGYNWCPIVLETSYAGTMTNIPLSVKCKGTMPVVPTSGTIYTGSTIYSKRLRTEQDKDISTLPSALGVGF